MACLCASAWYIQNLSILGVKTKTLLTCKHYIQYIHFQNTKLQITDFLEKKKPPLLQIDIIIQHSNLYFINHVSIVSFRSGILHLKTFVRN